LQAAGRVPWEDIVGLLHVDDGVAELASCCGVLRRVVSSWQVQRALWQNEEIEWSDEAKLCLSSQMLAHYAAFLDQWRITTPIRGVGLERTDIEICAALMLARYKKKPLSRQSFLEITSKRKQVPTEVIEEVMHRFQAAGAHVVTDGEDLWPAGIAAIAFRTQTKKPIKSIWRLHSVRELELINLALRDALNNGARHFVRAEVVLPRSTIAGVTAAARAGSLVDLEAAVRSHRLLGDTFNFSLSSHQRLRGELEVEVRIDASVMSLSLDPGHPSFGEARCLRGCYYLLDTCHGSLAMAPWRMEQSGFVTSEKLLFRYASGAERNYYVSGDAEAQRARLVVQWLDHLAQTSESAIAVVKVLIAGCQCTCH